VLREATNHKTHGDTLAAISTGFAVEERETPAEAGGPWRALGEVE
jgi:hypothetical protein